MSGYRSTGLGARPLVRFNACHSPWGSFGSQPHSKLPEGKWKIYLPRFWHRTGTSSLSPIFHWPKLVTWLNPSSRGGKIYQLILTVGTTKSKARGSVDSNKGEHEKCFSRIATAGEAGQAQDCFYSLHQL